MTEQEMQDAIMTITTLERKYQTAYPMWRRGQTLFNAVNSLYPEIADRLRGTDIDPFHRNDRYGECWDYIIRMLNDNDAQP